MFGACCIEHSTFQPDYGACPKVDEMGRDWEASIAKGRLQMALRGMEVGQDADAEAA